MESKDIVTVVEVISGAAVAIAFFYFMFKDGD